LRAETLVRRLQILPTKLSAATTKTALTFGARQTSKATMEDLAQSLQVSLAFDLMGVYRFCRKTGFFRSATTFATRGRRRVGSNKIGVGGGIRTLGHRNHNPALYQLSYTHHEVLH
jgi:hypothetical protein